MLNKNVLILNQSYEAVGVCNAKRAIIMIFLGKGEMIEKYKYLIRSAFTAYPLPSIIRLNRYITLPRKKILLSRKNILKRDNYRCQYCGKKSIAMTIDHVIPKVKGGTYSWDNLVCACIPCNHKKGNNSPEQSGLLLLTIPRKPNNIIFIKDVVGISDDRWKPYLFLN